MTSKACQLGESSRIWTERYTKVYVLAKRKDVSSLKPEDHGLRTADSNSHLAVFEHLTQRLQEWCQVVSLHRLVAPSYGSPTYNDL